MSSRLQSFRCRRPRRRCRGADCSVARVAPQQAGPVASTPSPTGIDVRAPTGFASADMSSRGYMGARRRRPRSTREGGALPRERSRPHPRHGVAGRQPLRNGYYALDNSGHIFVRAARSFGSMAGAPPHRTLIALAPTPSERGYWLLGRKAEVQLRDAPSSVPTATSACNAPIISMRRRAVVTANGCSRRPAGVQLRRSRFHGSNGNLN